MAGWLVVAGCTVGNPWFELAGASGTTAETGTPTGAGPGAETVTVQPTTQGSGVSTDEPVSTGVMTSVSSGPVTATEAVTITTGPELTGTGTSAGTDETGALPDMGVSLCGNGVTDPGEDCDDSNTLPGDGCENNCKFMFQALSPINVAQGVFDLAAADLDGDGLDDMVATYVTPDPNDAEFLLILNMGGGIFLITPKVELGWVGASRVLVGQLVGDARPDLLVVAAGTGKLRILENESVQGQLVFTPTNAIQVNNLAAVTDAALARLDGDGLDDLLLLVGEKLSVRLNDGVGGMGPPAAYPSPLAMPVAVFAGPLVKGDAKHHVGLVHATVGNDMSNFLNDGNGVLTKQNPQQERCGDGATTARVGDVDSGGPIDVVVGCKGGQLVVVGHDGLAPYERTVEAVVPTIVGAGAIDLYGGDEFADVYGVSAIGKAVVVGIASGKGFAKPYVENLEAGPTAAAVGDVDGDGAPDVMVVLAKLGQILLLRNQTRD